MVALTLPEREFKGLMNFVRERNNFFVGLFLYREPNESKCTQPVHMSV